MMQVTEVEIVDVTTTNVPAIHARTMPRAKMDLFRLCVNALSVGQV